MLGTALVVVKAADVARVAGVVVSVVVRAAVDVVEDTDVLKLVVVVVVVVVIDPSLLLDTIAATIDAVMLAEAADVVVEPVVDALLVVDDSGPMTH